MKAVKHIALLSDDEALVRFLQHLVLETLDTEFTCEAVTAGKVPAATELCICDYVPGETDYVSSLDSTDWNKYLFLIERKHLNALAAAAGTSNLNVLLKPVTAATFRAFLGGFRLSRNAGPGDSSSRLRTLRDERDEMLQFLIQANLKLQEFEQERTNFLARSIHDFRAPLTAVAGYCELLLEEALGPVTPDQREILGRMQHSAKRLTRATNSMFQLSVARHSEQKPNLEAVEIRDCVDQAMHELSLVIEQKRISVMVDMEPSPENLVFERSQIEQTLLNLLDNACRFTPRGGVIEVRGYPYFWERRTMREAAAAHKLDRRTTHLSAPNSFRVDIRDSGPGIPAAYSDRIFEEFTTYSGGQDRSGAGLGLAICRMALFQHGGRIWAETTAGGAVFSFVLPFHTKGLRGDSKNDRGFCATAHQES